MTLVINAIFDSSIADVLAFKCCHLPDQNLEIHVRNTGSTPVRIQPLIEFEGQGRTLTWHAVYPPYPQTIAPGDITALYTSIEPQEYRRWETVAVHDDNGRVFRQAL